MPNNPSVMETAAQVIDTTSKRKGLVNAATIAHMIAMPKKIHAIFPSIYILPFYEKQSSTKITIINEPSHRIDYYIHTHKNKTVNLCSNFVKRNRYILPYIKAS